MPCSSIHFSARLRIRDLELVLALELGAPLPFRDLFLPVKDEQTPGGTSCSNGGRAAGGTSCSRSPTIACTASAPGSSFGSRLARSG